MLHIQVSSCYVTVPYSVVNTYTYMLCMFYVFSNKYSLIFSQKLPSLAVFNVFIYIYMYIYIYIYILCFSAYYVKCTLIYQTLWVCLSNDQSLSTASVSFFKYRALISNIGQMFSSAFQRVYDVDSLYLYVCGLDINVSPDIMARFFSKARGELTLFKWCTDSHAITAGMSYLLFPANDSGSIPWKSGVMDTLTWQLFMNIIIIWSTLIQCTDYNNGSSHLNTVWGVFTSVIILCSTIIYWAFV